MSAEPSSPTFPNLETLLHFFSQKNIRSNQCFQPLLPPLFYDPTPPLTIRNFLDKFSHDRVLKAFLRNSCCTKHTVLWCQMQICLISDRAGQGRVIIVCDSTSIQNRLFTFSVHKIHKKISTFHIHMKFTFHTECLSNASWPIVLYIKT